MHPHGRGPTDGGCPPPLIPGGIFSMEGPEIPANKAGNWEVRGVGWLMAAGCLEVSTGPRGRKEQVRALSSLKAPPPALFLVTLARIHIPKDPWTLLYRKILEKKWKNMETVVTFFKTEP